MLQDAADIEVMKHDSVENSYLSQDQSFVGFVGGGDIDDDFRGERAYETDRYLLN